RVLWYPTATRHSIRCLHMRTAPASDSAAGCPNRALKHSLRGRGACGLFDTGNEPDRSLFHLISTKPPIKAPRSVQNRIAMASERQTHGQADRSVAAQPPILRNETAMRGSHPGQ